MKKLLTVAVSLFMLLDSRELQATHFTNDLGYNLTVNTLSAIVGQEIIVRWDTPAFGDATHIGMFPIGGELGDRLDGESIFLDFDNETQFAPLEEDVVEFWLYSLEPFHIYAVSEPMLVRTGTENLLDVRNYPALGRTNIVFLGDSLFAGFELEPGEDVVTRLSTLTGLRLINSSVSGDTTAEGLSRLTQSVLVHNPRVVFVLLGGNDFLTRQDFDDDNDIPQFRTFENLRIIIHLIHQAGSMVVLVGVQDELFNDNVEDNFQALAMETGCLYVPNILQGIIGRFEFTISDLLHPNVAGVETMANRLRSPLEALSRSEPLVLEISAGQNNTVVFSWASLPQTVYFLQLVPPPHLRMFPKYLATITGTGGRVSVTLPTTNGPVAFFRLREHRL